MNMVAAIELRLRREIAALKLEIASLRARIARGTSRPLKPVLRLPPPPLRRYEA